MKKIKVFFDALPISGERVSGIGHLLIETVKALERDSRFMQTHEIVLIHPKSAYNNIRNWGFKNVQYKPLPTKGRIWSALVLYRLLPPADLFFGRGVYIFANYTTWPLLLSKSITYVHDLNFLINPETVRQKTRKVLSRNLRHWIKRANRVVTISNFSKKEIQRLFNDQNKDVDVIYCGVDLEIFRPRDKKEIESIKKKYNLPERYIIFLSNIEPRKNVMRLLQAFEQIVNDDKDLGLVMIGAEGWLNESVHEKIDEINQKSIRIFRPETYVPDEDLPPLLSGAQALVHPALYEGFGISPLQAMACGTPVVISNTTSLPEVAGPVGIYVNPLSVGSIAKGIKKAVTHSSQSNDLVKQASLFTWDKAASSLAKVIDEV